MTPRSCPFRALLLFAAACSNGGGAPPTPPTISALSLSPDRLYASAAPVTFFVGMQVTDPNGDVTSVTFLVEDSGGATVATQTIPVTAPGLSNAQIQGSAVAPMPNVGVYTLSIFATDAGGRRSNVLTATIAVSPHPWADRAPHPLPLQDAAAVSLGDRLYVLGGSRQDLGLFPGPSTDLVTAYDPAADAWSPVPAMPTRRYDMAAAAANGRIYAIGGLSTPPNLPLGDAVAVVEAFDPATQVWSTRAPLPSPRQFAAAVALGTRVVVVGGKGFPGGTPLDSVLAYDPTLDVWAALPPMPRARPQPRAAVFGGRLFVAGRDSLGNCVDMIDVFDPTTGLWSTSFGPLRCGSALFELANELHWLHEGMIASADPITEVWHGCTPSPRTFDDRGAVAVLGGRLFVLQQTTFQRYDPALELP